MSANYTPEKEDLKILTPFKMQVLTNFPYIEADFDALTNYQLLCKIVEYLNNVIAETNEVTEQTESLYNAYVSLQAYINQEIEKFETTVNNRVDGLETYMNNYFNNLDVQQEINNKLDSMAADGTLTNLIKNYVDPIYETYESRINAEVADIKSQVDAATSGSPLVATSTSDMTKTDRVYVNTTDGKWYYYDGDSWEIGGTYQSTEDSNSVDVLNYSLLNLYDESMLINGYISADSIVTTDSFQYAKIPVSANTTYYIYQKNQTDGVVPFVEFAGNTPTYHRSYDYLVNIKGYDFIKITTAATTTHLGINVKLAIFDNTESLFVSTLPAITSTQAFDIIDYTLEQNQSPLITNNLMNTATILPNHFCRLGEMAENQMRKVKVAKVTVSPNTTYYLYRKSQDYTGVHGDDIIYYNSEDTKISYVSITNLETITIDGKNIKKFTTPANTSYLYLNVSILNFDDTTTTILSTIPTYYSLLGNDLISRKEVNDLKNNVSLIGINKWYAIGDSITEVNFRALHNYIYYIKQDMPISVTNLGASATGYIGTNASIPLHNNFIDRISSIPNTYNIDTDIITVMGSVNDVTNSTSAPIGEPGDTTTATLYGSMYQFFNTLFTNFTGARVGVISPIPWKYSGSESEKLREYVEALKYTAKLFNVPFLDLTDKSNLRPEDSDFLNEYYEADGTGNNHELDSQGIHPNSKGHRLFYKRIKEFINTL